MAFRNESPLSGTVWAAWRGSAWSQRGSQTAGGFIERPTGVLAGSFVNLFGQAINDLIPVVLRPVTPFVAMAEKRDRSFVGKLDILSE